MGQVMRKVNPLGDIYYIFNMFSIFHRKSTKVFESIDSVGGNDVLLNKVRV